MAYSIDIGAQDNTPIAPSVPGTASLAAVARSSGQATSEQAQADGIGAVVTSGTQDGVTATYSNVTKVVDFENTDKGSVAVATHVAAVDPHGDRAFATAEDAAHVSDTDPHGDRAFATSADADHVAATDPHGDRAYADGEDASHSAADRAYTDAGISAHSSATDPHGDRAYTVAQISAHSSATDPHGDRAYADGLDAANSAADQAYADAADAVAAAVAAAALAAHVAASDPHGDRAYADAEIAAAIAAVDLGDLADVTITAPAVGHIIEWNGSAWVNAAPSGGGGSYLPLAGGTLTGTLAVNSAASYNALSLPNNQYIGWNNSAGSTDDAGIKADASNNMVFYSGTERVMLNAATGVFNSRGQGRFGGWWDGTSAVVGGRAVEVGISSGDNGHIINYNRNTATYGPLYVEGSSVYCLSNGVIRLEIQDAACNFTNTLKQDGKIVLPNTSAFNNSGDGHGTNTDFSSLGAGAFGMRYFSGSYNGPTGTPTHQYYTLYTGLGAEYGDTYGSQLAWPRTGLANDGPYMYLRCKEGPTWAGWQKMWAGYADSVGTWAHTNQPNAADMAVLAQTNGVHRMDASFANGPPVGGYGNLLTLRGNGSDTATQIYGDYGSGNLYSRGGNGWPIGGGSFSGWALQLSSANYAAYSAFSGIVSGQRFVSGWDSTADNSFSCSNWFRTIGDSGIFFSSYSVGLWGQTGSYGSVKAYGDRGGYQGFMATTTNFMAHTNGEHYGDYKEGTGWANLTYWNSGGTSIVTHFTGNLIAYSTTSSDRKLKKDIEPIRNALDRVLQITGVSYRMIEDDRPSVGVIAQDVQAVFPELVNEVKSAMRPDMVDVSDTHLTVAYGQLVGPIIEALREINERLKRLEEKA